MMNKKYAIENNFIKGPTIESSALGEVKIIRFKSPFDEITKANSEYQFYDFSLPIKDQKFENFCKTFSQIKAKKSERQKLTQSFENIYGMGFEIAKNMPGFEINKEFGPRGAGIKKPIELVKYKFLGQNIDKAGGESLNNDTFKPNEKNINDHLDKFMAVANTSFSSQNFILLIERFLPVLRAKDVFLNKIKEFKSIIFSVSPFFNKIEDFYLEKIDENEDTSQMLKENLEILAKNKDDLNEIQLILQETKDFQQSIQKTVIFDDFSVDSLMVILQIFIASVKAFPEMFFKYKIHLLILSIIQKTIINFTKQIEYLSFWENNIQEIEIICSFLKFLDYFCLHSKIQIDRNDEFLKKGFLDYFVFGFFCQFFQKFIEKNYNSFLAFKLSKIIEIGFKNKEKNSNSFLIFPAVFKMCILPFLIKNLKSNLLVIDYFEIWKTIIESFEKSNQIKIEISTAIKSTLCKNKKHLDEILLGKIISNFSTHLNSLDLTFLVCVIFLPKFLGKYVISNEEKQILLLQNFELIKNLMPKNLKKHIEHVYLLKIEEKIDQQEKNKEMETEKIWN